MKRVGRSPTALIFALLFLLPGILAAREAPAAGPPAAEIAWLIRHVAESGLLFLRNGDEHAAAEAAAHMERKYRHFADDIDSAETFIAKAATRSLLSGRPYLVILPDGTRRPTADWLRDALERHRREAAVRVSRQEVHP